MYKVGDPFETTLEKAFNNKEQHKIIGSLMALYVDGKLVAKYEVKEVDGLTIKGRITNTYNHKRRKNVTISS